MKCLLKFYICDLPPREYTYIYTAKEPFLSKVADYYTSYPVARRQNPLNLESVLDQHVNHGFGPEVPAEHVNHLHRGVIFLQCLDVRPTVAQKEEKRSETIKWLDALLLCSV